MPNPVFERLQRHGVRPRKELGQHFLVDTRLLDRIVAWIDPAPGCFVVEYGAGIGILTEKLLQAGATVVAIELDDAMARILESELAARPGFKLIHADLTRVSVTALQAELQAPDVVLAGNLPYQLTSHVLFGVLDLETALRAAVFMVQREVAERIVAPPGTKTYGILSVLLRTWHDVEILQRVKPGSFAPPPRVESAVLRIRPRAAGLACAWNERPALVRLVKSAFAERRKVLRNTLRKFYPLDDAQLTRISAASRIDLGRRPETLGAEEFVRLLHAVGQESHA
jgi:16S rRNA (adenine1518-N6/adenine1519-N6)-dimethyltransferase